MATRTVRTQANRIRRHERGLKSWLRWGLFIVAVCLLAWMGKPLLRQLPASAAAFKSARWGWLVAALLFQGASLACLTWINLLALEPFDGRITFGSLAAVLTALAFVTAAVPSGGASGILLRARLLKKHGYTAEASTFTFLLEFLFLSVGTVLFMLFGQSLLLLHGVRPLASVVTLVVLMGLIAVLFLFGRFFLFIPERVGQFTARVIALWNRWAGRFRTLDTGEIEARISSFRTDLERTRSIPRWTLSLATAGRLVLELLTLGACFACLGLRINPGVLVFAYGLMLLMNGLSLLPGGMGLVDLSFPILLFHLGIPEHTAVAAGLSYRLISFWLLRAIGLVSWRILESQSRGSPGFAAYTGKEEL